MLLTSAEYTITPLYDGENFYRAWADTANGSGATFSKTDSNRAYIGTYVGPKEPTSYTQYQWTKMLGAPGKDSVVAILSNDSYTIPTNSEGLFGNYDEAKTTLSVYEGINNVSTLWNVSVTVSTGVTGTLTSKTYEVSDLSTDEGSVTLTASRSGYPSIVKVFSLSKTKQGLAGESTANYYLLTDTSHMERNALTKLLTPSFITVDMFKQVGQDTPEKTPVYFVVHEQAREALTIDAYTEKERSGTLEADMEYIVSDKAFPYVERYVSNTPEDMILYTPQTDAKSLLIETYLDENLNELLDTQTVPILSDGLSPIVHIAYADDINGANMTFDSNTDRNYLGQYTSYEEEPSLDSLDYTWVLTKGHTVYTWTRYADTDTGGGMSADPEGKKYLGLSHNQLQETPSENPNDYQWSAMYDVAIIDAFTSQVENFEDIILPALEDKLLSASEKQSVKESLRYLTIEQSSLNALVDALLLNKNLTNKAPLTTAKTNYNTAYTGVATAINNITNVSAGQPIPASLITAYNTTITTYVTRVNQLQSAIQVAQQAIESVIETLAEAAKVSAEKANSNLNSLRQAQERQIDIRLGMKIGYSSWTQVNANSIYLSGLELNPATYQEELVNKPGSIYIRDTRETYAIPNQALNLSGAPAATPLYITWNNTSSKLFIMYHETIYSADNIQTSRWRDLAGQTIQFNESVFVLGEVEKST